MQASLISFIGHLRDNGIRVSQAELTDTTRALSRLPLETRSLFKDPLRSTLVKRSRDISLFDSLFDLHFSGVPVTGSAPTDIELRSLDDLRSTITKLQSRSDEKLSPVTEMFLTGRFGPLVRLAMNRSRMMGMDQMLTAPIRGRFFLNRLRKELDLDRIQVETDALLSGARSTCSEKDAAGSVREYVARNLARLEEVLAGLVQREIGKNRFQALQRIEDDDIAERNLFQLTDRDIRSMRPEVDRLAGKLKDRLSLRFRHGDRGRFDLKSTFRKNIGYGGPLPEVHFRKKKPARPQVVALCDVSGSVRNFSRFMLLFLYTLKEVISRVRSFIFVGDLAEVTRLFQEYDLNEAVSLAAAGYGLAYPFGTDYGASFAQFTDEHLTTVTSKTTVIILGDARTNRLPPRVDALEAIADRARKVIWLNPESSLTWSLGDSVMHLYRPLCTTVAECGNLVQLARVIEDHLGP